MNLTIETIVAAVTTLIVTLIAGIVPSVQFLWFLPLVGGCFSTAGLFFGKKTLVDGGSLFSIASFLYIQRLTDPIFTNLILVLLLFFLLFTTFVVNRRAILLSLIKGETVGTKNSAYLQEFQLDSIISISSTLLAAFILALVGTVVAIYSSLNLNLHPDQAVVLVMFLAGSFFFIIFVILDVIPILSDKE